MKNLIVNSFWNPGPDGGPQYFTSTGPVTYDAFSLNGYRTCSITIAKNQGAAAGDSYDLPIPVHGERAITWGYVIRAIDADEICLTAAFSSSAGQILETVKCPVTRRVVSQFSRQMAEFRIPDGAQTVRLGLAFAGRVTACTFCAPAAYFS